MNVLYVIGWFFLAASWIVPYVMKKMGKDDGERSLVVMILWGIACGVLVRTLVIQLIG